jgi:O-6-methylguanine DNA methyltransferase
MLPDGREIVSSAIGEIEVASLDGKIISCTFSALYSAAGLEPNALTSEACKQLKAYFQGELKVFDLPLHYEGTALQLKVMKMLELIPYGVTTSYGEMAKKLEIPSGSRAVGNLIGKNPLLILVPCHRVLGTDKKITGYAGGPDRKLWLLQHELKFQKKPGTFF